MDDLIQLRKGGKSGGGSDFDTHFPVNTKSNILPKHWRKGQMEAMNFCCFLAGL